MLILISSDDLDFQFTLNQDHNEVLNGLRSAFIDKFGEDIYTKAAKVVVVENHFYNVIKDRYGNPIIGEHNDNVYDMIDAHLSI